jgi:hypothetical protein
MLIFKFRCIFKLNSSADQKRRRRNISSAPPPKLAGLQLVVGLFNILSTSFLILSVRQSALMASEQVHNIILMKLVSEDVREKKKKKKLGEGAGGAGNYCLRVDSIWKISCGSSVNIVTKLRAGRPQFDSRQVQEFSLGHRVQTRSGFHRRLIPRG